jgi:hypothetical protein
MYRVEKRKVSVKGKASLGWFLGRGYVQRMLSVSVERWCVTFDGQAKPVCICYGKAQAEKIACALNSTL